MAHQDARWNRTTIVLAIVPMVLVLSYLSFRAFLALDARGFLEYRNVSGAMSPALLEGDVFTVRPVENASGTRITRTSIVAHAWPPDPDKAFVKRVVGLPGDTIAMIRGMLYVNGRSLAEPYAHRDESEPDPVSDDFAWQRPYVVRGPTTDTAHYVASRDEWGPLVVPDNNYFVLGDNRDNSLDSRYWGFLPSEDVIGIVRRVLYSADPQTGRIRWNRLGHRVR